MRVLKAKTFARWARKQRLEDAMLAEAVAEMRRGLVDADLGAGLLKKRVARLGQGKRGGWRVLLASNRRGRWVFLYGFAKNERDDLDEDEERDVKLLAQAYLGMSEDTIRAALAAGELQEIRDDETQASQ